MKKNFRETIHQRPDDELSRIAKDYAFYSTEERLLAMNELKKRSGLPDNKKHTTSSPKRERMLYFFLIVLSVIFLLKIGMRRQHSELELRDTIKIEGTVESVGIIRQRLQIRGRRDPLIFSIQLSDRDERFNVFRQNEDYADLIENIQVGDRLIVYFRRNNSQRENRNVGVVQIEKNGEMLLDISEFNTRERTRMYYGIFGLLVCVFILFALLRDKFSTLRSRKRRAG